MKIDDNGIIREMTAEEIAEMERMAEEFIPLEKSDMEKQLDELTLMMADLLGGAL